MLGYIGTRVLLVLPTLFGVTLVTFVLTYILPGNPALVKAGPLATPQHIAEMERRMGLDQPMAVQYWRYVRGLAHGDLGESHTTGRPVLEDLLQRVPATLELTLAALAVALVIGIPLGVVAAVRRDGWVDHLSRLLGVGGVAMPTFWTGLLAAGWPPASPRRRGSPGSSRSTPWWRWTAAPSPPPSTSWCCPRWCSASRSWRR